MAKVMMVKKLSALYPANETAEALMRRLKQNEMVSVDVSRPRNVKFNAKLFAMLQIILQNQEAYKSIDDLLEICKLRIGHCRTVATKHGDVQIPNSISFASMDEDSFAEFYDRACGWVITEVIPGLERAGLDEAVAEELRGFGAPE